MAKKMIRHGRLGFFVFVFLLMCEAGHVTDGGPPFRVGRHDKCDNGGGASRVVNT